MVLVGRDAELAEVLDAALRVPTAGLVVAAVSGAPGIGKSRLLTEVADRLAGRGWRVLTVAGDRLERQIPYGVLAAAVRGLAADNAYTEGLRQDVLAARWTTWTSRRTVSCCGSRTAREGRGTACMKCRGGNRWPGPLTPPARSARPPVGWS
jgi:hypothetical protein